MQANPRPLSARHRQIFRDGAAQKNISQGKADEIFDLMEKFAGYGFNSLGYLV